MAKRIRLPSELTHPVVTHDPSVGAAFLAGVDPRGTWTLQLGRETRPKHWNKMQLAGILGGLVGGGLVIPGVIGGVARVVPTLMTRNARNLKSVLNAFTGGASDIYKRVWRAFAGSRALKRAAKEHRALTPKELEAVKRGITSNVTIGEAADKLLGAKTFSPADTIEAVKKLARPNTVITPEMAEPVVKALRKGSLTGALAIGGAGGVTGFSAFKQYNLGQKLREEQADAKKRVQKAHRMGLYTPVPNQEKLSAMLNELVKKSVTVHPIPPHSSLTARSEFVTKKRYKPKPPNPITTEEQTTLDNMHAGSSHSAQRQTEAHKRGRTTLT